MTEYPSVRDRVMLGQSSTIRSLLLTDNQIMLVNWVEALGCITSSELSIKKKISVQNANGKLDVLYRKGYLSRTTESADTGGIEHCYTRRHYE